MIITIKYERIKYKKIGIIFDAANIKMIAKKNKKRKQSLLS